MPKQKLSRSPNGDSIINVCDTTTLAPAIEQQDDLEKPQRTRDVTGYPNNQQRRIRRKKNNKHAQFHPAKHEQEIPVPTYRFEPYSNTSNVYCLNQFVNGMNTSEEIDQDFSSDEEFQDSLHQQYNSRGEETEHGISDDDGKTTSAVQETSGSKSRVPEEVRLRINSRERQRMHDLNSALDSLRQVMPYSSGPSVKKLSKMSTLLLARNYIVMLTRSLEEMKRLVQEMSASRRLPPPPPPPLPPATLPPPPSSTATPAPHLSVPTALSSLPLISNPSAYAALLSAHSTIPGGFMLPASLFQIPQMLPAAALAHHPHHHTTGLSSCLCYYCKKFRSALSNS